MILSVNQLSINGAVADLRAELSKDSSATGKPVAHENLAPMVIQTEVPIAHCDDQPNVRAQGNLLAEYELKLAALPEQEKLIKLCSNAGFSKLTETLDDGVLIDDMKVTRREYTLPRNYESSRVKAWIRGNTKIGPVLDVKICHHQKRYGVEIMIESLLGDKTASWVRVMSGNNKDVTETSFLLKILETVCAGKHAARSKAKPKPTPTDTSSHVKREIKDEVKQEPSGQMSIPFHERQWIDMEPAVFSRGFLEVSKHMIRLLRHGEEVPRERDGAVKFDDVMENFKSGFRPPSNGQFQPG